MVHALPSSQGLAPGTCVHVPVALQTSSVQSFPSFVHAVPGGSSRQRAEQQSPSALTPTSQFSKGSITPFPHLVAERGKLQAGVLDVHVLCVSSPSPVPEQKRSAHSPGIAPLTVNAPVDGSTVPSREKGNDVEPDMQDPVVRVAVPVCTVVRLHGSGVVMT
jgi:hypothetical protein